MASLRFQAIPEDRWGEIRFGSCASTCRMFDPWDSPSEPLSRQQPTIDLADCLQDHRIFEVAKRRVAVRENAMAPQCPSVVASESALRIAC